MSEFKIGDVVKVIGPDCSGLEDLGLIIQITEIDLDKNIYATRGSWWYPSSSLRKVCVVDDEELHIGDWVEVVGPVITDGVPPKTVFCITQTDRENDKIWFSDWGKPRYPASSLRKLSPDRISSEVEPTEYILKCDWCNKDLGKCGINKGNNVYCSVICSVMAEDHTRLDAIEKRLDAGARLIKKLIDGQEVHRLEDEE